MLNEIVYEYPFASFDSREHSASAKFLEHRYCPFRFLTEHLKHYKVSAVVLGTFSLSHDQLNAYLTILKQHTSQNDERAAPLYIYDDYQDASKLKHSREKIIESIKETSKIGNDELFDAHLYQHYPALDPSNYTVGHVECHHYVNPETGDLAHSRGVYHPKFMMIFCEEGLALAIGTSNATSNASIEGTWTDWFPALSPTDSRKKKKQKSAASRCDDKGKDFALHLSSFLEQSDSQINVAKISQRKTQKLQSWLKDYDIYNLDDHFNFSRVCVDLVSTVPGRFWKHSANDDGSKDKDAIDNEVSTSRQVAGNTCHCSRSLVHGKNYPTGITYGLQRLRYLLSKRTQGHCQGKDKASQRGTVHVQQTSFGERFTDSYIVHNFMRDLLGSEYDQIKQHIENNYDSSSQSQSQSISGSQMEDELITLEDVLLGKLKFYWPDVVWSSNSYPIKQSLNYEDQTGRLPRSTRDDDGDHISETQNSCKENDQPITVAEDPLSKVKQAIKETEPDGRSKLFCSMNVLNNFYKSNCGHTLYCYTPHSERFVQDRTKGKNSVSSKVKSEEKSNSFGTSSRTDNSIIDLTDDSSDMGQQQDPSSEQWIIDYLRHTPHIKTYSREASSTHQQTFRLPGCTCTALSWSVLTSQCFSLGALGQEGPTCSDIPLTQQYKVEGQSNDAKKRETKECFYTQKKNRNYTEYKNFELGVLFNSQYDVDDYENDACAYAALDADCPLHGLGYLSTACESPRDDDQQESQLNDTQRTPEDSNSENDKAGPQLIVTIMRSTSDNSGSSNNSSNDKKVIDLTSGSFRVLPMPYSLSSEPYFIRKTEKTNSFKLKSNSSQDNGQLEESTILQQQHFPSVSDVNLYATIEHHQTITGSLNRTGIDVRLSSQQYHTRECWEVFSGLMKKDKRAYEREEARTKRKAKEERDTKMMKRINVTSSSSSSSVKMSKHSYDDHVSIETMETDENEENIFSWDN